MSYKVIISIVCLSLFLLAGYKLTVLYLARTSNLIVFWNAENDKSVKTIEHYQWQLLLDKYLNTRHISGVNRFDYGAVTPKDKLLLSDYLNYLSSIDIADYTSQEQLAFWVNLYNALTVNLVLQQNPEESIKQIGQGISGLGPWDDEVFMLSGKNLTLNNIEHGILRPKWQDSRIHFVINCASLGCPNLAAQAMTADNSEQLLEQSAIDFINHRRGVDLTDDGLILSSIFKWYQADFGDNQQQLIETIAKYAKPQLQQKLLAYDGEIRYQYNWKLNANQGN